MTGNDDMLKEILAKIGENQELLREIARWSRFQNIGKLVDSLTTELDTDEKKLAFENTDGAKGIKEIAQACGAPQDTVYSWWKKWFRLGLVTESETRKGRMTKIISLEDVWIKVPKRTLNVPDQRPTQAQHTGASESTVLEGEKREKI